MPSQGEDDHMLSLKEAAARMGVPERTMWAFPKIGRSVELFVPDGRLKPLRPACCQRD
jgi:hypothetical protein